MRTLGLVVLGLVMACASLAAAQERRVAVDRFRGPRAAHARSLLVRELEDAGYTVVSDTEVAAARRTLGYGTGTLEAAELVAIARQLNAQAIIDGRVGHVHRAWRLVVHVRDGSTGADLGDESWGGRTQSAIDGVGRDGADRLRSYLERATTPGATTTTATPTTSERPWYEHDAEAPTDDERPTDEPDDETPRPSSTRYDSVRFSVSGGSLGRSMQADARVYAIRRGMTPADPSTALIDETRGYGSSGIGGAELGLEAEFFPGALGDQPFPYLGIIASFRHSALLTSSGCRRPPPNNDCTGASHLSIGTDQLDVQGGLRFRYRLGADRRDVQLFGDVIYGYSNFTFDTGANGLQALDYQAIIPPMGYQWLGIFVGFDYGIIPDAFFVQLRTGYRIGVGLDPVSRNVWGVDSSTAGGFDVQLELKHEATWLAEGIFVSLRFEYFQFMTTFRGQVGCATSTCSGIGTQPWLNNDLWELWPVGADNSTVVGGIRDPVMDHYVRWGLYLGYAFR
jgi:hypothetical protein